MAARPTTIAELRSSGWVSRSVKEEVRANTIARISAGQPLFDGVLEGLEEIPRNNDLLADLEFFESDGNDSDSERLDRVIFGGEEIEVNVQ